MKEDLPQPDLDKLRRQRATKLSVDSITAQVEEVAMIAEKEPDEELLVIRTANKRLEDASKLPIQRKLIGELWHEGELCILFGDTGTGKSILAVQGGESISLGARMRGIEMLECGVVPQRTLYLDYELSDTQFRLRYAIEDKERKEFFGDYGFSENFTHATLNHDIQYKGIETEQEYEARMNVQIEKAIQTLGVNVLIVDNITYLKSEVDKGKNALPFMKYLKSLKDKYKISILVLAHTPKRDDRQPISLNDLAGSKMLSNFADSIFTIGKSSKSSDTRYIKQLKYRNGAMLYDAENVIVCRLEKPNNFTQFTFTGFGRESEHLFKASNLELEDMQGAKGNAIRFLKNALKDGAVESAKLWKNAQAEDIAEATLKRAKKDLGVISYQKTGRHYTELSKQDEETV